MHNYNLLREGLPVVILVLFISLSIIPSTVGVEKSFNPAIISPTIVSIQPPVTIVEPGETFEVDIYVEPGEPIAGISFEYLFFNPNFILANSVFFDCFFHPYFTFCYFDNIDNVNGYIYDCYEILLEPGGVGTSGSWVTIEFTAQQQSGTSFLNLSGVIVAEYYGSPVPIEVYNGTVTVLDDEPPEITNVILTTSDPLDTEPGFGWENFTCTVTDDTEVEEVKLIVNGPWWPPENEYPMTNIPVTDIYYYNLTFTCPWTYNYHIWANDTSGNENVSEQYTFWLPSNCDIDMNGIIHFMDFIAVSMAYNEEGPPGWIREDLDNNGRVHFMDLVQVSQHYNECWK